MDRQPDRLLPLLVLLGALPFAALLTAIAGAWPLPGAAAIAIVLTGCVMMNPC